MWFNLRQLSTITRREGATLAPLSPAEDRQRVCTGNCRQIWQQMADAAAEQGIPFLPMRNGIPDFCGIPDFREGQHLDVKQDAPATKLSLADQFKRFYNFSTRTSGITRLRRYCNTTWQEAQHLHLTPTHVKQSFPPSSIFKGPASATFARPPTHVSTMLHNAALLRRKQTAEGLRIPIATHAATDTSMSAAYIRQLSHNMREDTVPLASMKAHLTTHRKDIFAVK